MRVNRKFISLFFAIFAVFCPQFSHADWQTEAYQIFQETGNNFIQSLSFKVDRTIGFKLINLGDSIKYAGSRRENRPGSPWRRIAPELQPSNSDADQLQTILDCRPTNNPPRDDLGKSELDWAYMPIPVFYCVMTSSDGTVYEMHRKAFGENVSLTIEAIPEEIPLNQKEYEAGKFGPLMVTSIKLESQSSQYSRKQFVSDAVEALSAKMDQKPTVKTSAKDSKIDSILNSPTCIAADKAKIKPKAQLSANDRQAESACDAAVKMAYLQGNLTARTTTTYRWIGDGLKVSIEHVDATTGYDASSRATIKMELVGNLADRLPFYMKELETRSAVLKASIQKKKRADF
jgi:hypothetical protein